MSLTMFLPTKMKFRRTKSVSFGNSISFNSVSFTLNETLKLFTTYFGKYLCKILANLTVLIIRPYNFFNILQNSITRTGTLIALSTNGIETFFLGKT